MAKRVDPICGMPVEEEWAAARAEHEGRDYYFCSHGCKEKFNEDPWRYASREAPKRAPAEGR